MIKECKVITWNELVMVVDYEGILVQMPSTKTKVNIAYVKYENKNYQLASKEDYNKSLVNQVKKESKKEVSKIDE